jgi:hypothetical protein
MPYYDISDAALEALGTLYAGNSQAVAVPESIRWDCSIGGLPFLYGISERFPLKRETASFRRDRVDTAIDPGEQSLDSGYWLLSQSSWHYGSGLASAEPLEVDAAEARFRYREGGGVDPWTPGELSLLNATSLVISSSGGRGAQRVIGVNTGVLHADGTVLKYLTTGGSTSTVTWGGSATSIVALTSDGANYYASNSTGIYKGALPSSAGSLVWNTGSAAVVTGWVKSRLMAAVGLSLYELTGTGPTLPTALFTHPTTGWTWTDFSEGPTAIYVSGYSGDTSIIYKIGVNSSTSAITLNQPVAVAEMPRGESVLSLYAYVGTYLVVGTSKGTRIASIQSDGSLELGPLLVTSGLGCMDAVAEGSYVYVAAGKAGSNGDRADTGGLWRIDLGSPLPGNPLRFPVAADLALPSGIYSDGSVESVTSAEGSLYFTAAQSGLYKQQDTFVPEGWLETGRIRMSTIENKAWREIRILQDSATTGTITAYADLAGSALPDTWGSVVATSTGVYDIAGSLATVAPGPEPSLYVAFKLVRGDTTHSPSFVGYQVRSIPSPNRTELVQVPLMCFDRETDRGGTRYGKDGGAWARYKLLKLMEGQAGIVAWRDYQTGENVNAVIEQVGFTRLSPPTHGFSGSGGIIMATLRLV